MVSILKPSIKPFIGDYTMAKKLKTTFLTCETLDLLSVILSNPSHTVDIDVLTTNIYLDMQKADLTLDQARSIRDSATSSFIVLAHTPNPAKLCLIVEAFDRAAAIYIKYDIVR